MTFFSLIRLPLTFFPYVLSLLAESTVSVRRLQDFFQMQERLPSKQGLDIVYPVKIMNGDFVWEDRDDDDADAKDGKSGCMPVLFSSIKPQDPIKPKHEPGKLQNINIQVKQGDLCMIVGSVGSGKSSILHALLGDMRNVQGDVSITGSVGFASQQGWIQNTTLRENILFGLSYDEQMYQNIIKVCALEKDIAMLSNGDLTEIGERGIVSGYHIL